MPLFVYIVSTQPICALQAKCSHIRELYFHFGLQFFTSFVYWISFHFYLFTVMSMLLAFSQVNFHRCNKPIGFVILKNNDNKIVYVLTKKCSELQVWHKFRPKQMETAKYWLSFECVCWNKAVKYQRHIDNTWIISRVYSRDIDYLKYSFVFSFYIYETVRLFSDPFRCCFSLPRYLCILAMEQFVCMGEKRSVYVCVYVIAYACAYVCMSYVRLLWEMELQQTMW